MAKLKSFVSLYCCDICLTELVTFCEMYEALESLRLELLQTLERISNKSKYFQFQSSVENCRKRSFPRVKLERLPNPNQVEQEESSVNRELVEITESVSNLEAQTQTKHQLDDEDFDRIEMASNGIPTPSSSLHENNDDDSTDIPEAAAGEPMNILQPSHFSMGQRNGKLGEI